MPVTPHPDIRIGTMAGKGRRTAEYIRQLVPLGFESFQINFWQHFDGLKLSQLNEDCKTILEGTGITISTLGIYGNPLGELPEDEVTRRCWEECIDQARSFGTDLVCGFTGRVIGKSIPDSLPRFREVFSPLAKRAADRGVRLAFENCPMGGDWHRGEWNLAHNPRAWNLLFDAVPSPQLGLEWEPCHQMCQLIDPLPQLKQWTPKIFHLHGKDASLHWDVVRTEGVIGPDHFAFHRTPGFGDTDWTRVISELRRFGYRGSIDIEGWHDPVYKGDWEMTGQVHALRYLQQCRGGAIVPNPPIP
jgi:sugar phosphate isomerase/epimerase